MRLHVLFISLGLFVGANTLGAQQRDSTQRADSIAKARADSIAAADSVRLVREIERIRGEPRAQFDTVPPMTAAQIQPRNPRLLPDISVVGDLIADLSSEASTQEDGTRLGVREVEVAFQAAVDPYFRGDVFLGLSDAEGIAIEQAFLTTTSLPWGLEARLGRFLMPVGKQNTTHRHDLHTVEYPYVIQRFFGPEGLKGTGIYVSKIFAPFGFYQELQATALENFAAESEAEDLVLERPLNRSLEGLGYSARLRNYWDLTEAANLEISASAITGKRAQPLDVAPEDVGSADFFNAAAARQTVAGADITYRWRPLQQGLYRSFIFQAEIMRQFNERSPNTGGIPYAGPTENVTGGYAFARYQVGRRLYVGARYDRVDLPSPGDGLAAEDFSAASLYLQFYPSEFSKLLAGYERTMPGFDEKDRNRIILQATFAIGPHKPHPF